MASKIIVHKTNMRAKVALVAALGAAFVFAVSTWRHGSADSVLTSTQQADASHQGNDVVRTFSGTTPDGTFATSGKDLVLSPELIKRFEYHLAAVGELTIEQIKAAIIKDINAELNEKGQKEALRILEAYLKLKTTLGGMHQSKMNEVNAAALAQNFKAIRDLRAQYFQPAEIKALFGNADEYDDYTVDKLALMQNKSLSDKERAAKLDALKAGLSAENRANVEQPVLHLAVAEKVEQARQNGATPEQIRQIRTDMVGADAAKRLENLDQEEAAWKARIKQYQEARAADPDKAQQLKATLFSPQEQLRLAAYE